MALSNTFHLVIFGAFAFGFYYDMEYTTAPADSRELFVRKSIAGRFKYLTVINYVFLQCGYFGLCILNDLVGTNLNKDTGRSTLQTFRDWVFTTVTVPITGLVCSLFWGLYMIDRELIYPESMDTWFPKWLNHFYHTLPVIATIAELCLVYHTFQKGMQRYIAIGVCGTAYIAWLYYIANTFDFWVYPVFEVLKYPVREAVMAVMIAPAIIFLYLGEKLHHLVWKYPKKGPSEKHHSPRRGPPKKTTPSKKRV